MATLNTLRTRGAIILTIAIGAALIAFLLQDFIGTGTMFYNRKNSVGKIEGNNIDYQTYYVDAENLTNTIQALYGRSSLTTEEMEQVRQMVWDNYIRQYAFHPGFEALGITVEDLEQYDMMKGQFISPVISSMFSTPTQPYDPSMINEIMMSLGQTPQGEVAWNYIKSEAIKEREFSKYIDLVQSAIFANDIEVQRGIAAANNSFSGRFVSLPYTQIADSLVNVSSSDIKKFYDRNKNMFKQTAARDIEYVVFDLLPSDEDYAEAEKHVNELAAEFAAAENPMQYASLNSQERADIRFYKESELSNELAALAFGANRGQMTGPTLSGDVYTMSRLAEIRYSPDSVGARHILLPREKSAAADSLVKAIKGGADIFALARTYSMDPTVDLGIFTPERMVEPFAGAVAAANKGDVFSVVTDFGTHVVQMTYRSPVVPKAQIATVTYRVTPSSLTEQEVYNQAHTFVTAAAGSADKFTAAVSDMGLSRRVATVSAQEREVRGLDGSRELVRWSFTNKKGAVSSIMDIEGGYVVALMKDAREDGYATVEAVSADIASRLRNDKKAEMLKAQLQGKSFDEAAALEGAKSGEFENISFSAFYIPDLGVEPAVIGAMQAVAAGSVSKPVKGASGVYLVAVDNIAVSEEATALSEKVRLEATAETSFPQRLMQALNEKVEIKDNRVKF